jgi:hypothetical protein
MARPEIQAGLFRLAFLLACLLYLWFQSLFVQTAHKVVGARHVFEYNWVGIGFALGFNLIPIAAAVFLWRVKKDRIGAGIFLLCIPMLGCFVLPQLFMERVEITPTHLIHRREPPHTRFNADVAFADVASATELDLESGLKGYVLRLKNGTSVELPANTVLTSARDLIDTRLNELHIPVTARFVKRPAD